MPRGIRPLVTRPEVRDAAHRFHVVLTLAAGVGISTGLIVAGFDKAVREGLFAAVLRQPLSLAAAVPALGLVVAVVVIGKFGHGDPATTDAFVRSYHERGGQMRLRDLGAKLVASAATLGSGGAMGFEGPAILIGGSIGSTAERRFMHRLRQDDAKVLMVAGAAAGVAAVFKAPLTGIVFALEVPYHQDLARRALLPVLVSASCSYVVFVALLGTKPVLAAGGVAPFDLRDLLGGLAVGAVCGVLARLGARAIGYAKHVRAPVIARVLGAGVAIFVLAFACHHWIGSPLTLGSGYDAITWASQHERATALLATLFFLRFAATWCTVAGGGVGGLFIPLVTQGALAGAFVQSVVHGPNPGLFPTVGIAAFLGAGYRTPLAGVAFVAEATGQPGFVVPALLAAAAAQLAVGRWSLSPYQRDERRADLVALDSLRIDELMSPDPDTVAADLSLDETVQFMLRQNRRWAPVVDDGVYIGLLAVTDVARVPRAEWSQTHARDVMRADVPTVRPTDSVTDVARMIRNLDVGAVAVLDDTGVAGVVTIRDIGSIERLVERLNRDT